MATASRERHFVVSASGPVDLDLILAELAPGDSDALSQGRVFVDGKRADASPRNIALGSRVTWVAARSLSLKATDLEFEILDRHEDLLIVSKPSAWSSEPDRAGARGVAAGACRRTDRAAKCSHRNAVGRGC
jgi:23S rRNA-/tRNA-specific pseudouridylate synthase